MTNNNLVDFATKEAQLVWNRYGCMIVANSILLGFIGQLATQKCYAEQLGIYACGLGTLIAFLWLFITSYGWSLSYYILKASSNSNESNVDELTVYQQWKNDLCVWKKLPFDPIWCVAHAVIVIFCIAYIFLAFHFSTNWVMRWIFIIGNLIGFVVWLLCVPKPKDKQKQ